MDVFEGTIRNGQVILDVPVTLPDGMRVEIAPIVKQESTQGMREDDWPTTPEGIAALLARMEQVEPGWLSPEDDDSWRSALDAQKQAEKAQFMEEADKLRGMWQ
jgi:hypothetical protein